MKRTLLLLLAFLSAGFLFLSCGYSSPSSSGNSVSGIAARAFVTQDVNGGGVGAAINIVDSRADLLSFTHTITAGNTPGMMVVTPNRNQTLVFSPSDADLSIINNAAETNARQITLPGMTQSFVVSPDSTTAYVAVPAARVVGQGPGAIEIVNLANGAITNEISCFTPKNPPGPCAPQVHTYQYLSISHNGNRILAFSNSPDTIDSACAPPNLPCYLFVITPSNVGTQVSPVASVSGFDHPVAAFFSNDDNTAYVVNCGANCGGTQASVQTLDLITNTPGTPVNIPAAEAATVVGTTMYLAGTPVPASPCTDQQTQATTCGLLTIFDLPTMSVIKSGIIITDGYHDHIAMGANGQLFVGAHNCTEILPSGNINETRGCLSIYNTQTGAVVIPPASGDVTGLQPIANRSVVYLVQKDISSGSPVGELRIYDTTTDKLHRNQIDIGGDAVDVVTVDF